MVTQVKSKLPFVYCLRAAARVYACVRWEERGTASVETDVFSELQSVTTNKQCYCLT